VLSAKHLTLDLLLGPAQLNEAVDLVSSHPDVQFVLDHFAGVRITPGKDLEFASSLQPFAALSNAAMKVSGYLTLAAEAPLPTLSRTLQPYLDAALDIFGSDRLLFGSDWSVCTQRGTYADVVGTLRTLTSALSLDEQAAIWGDTATRVYRL
jgi:L-fuconolactonase